MREIKFRGQRIDNGKWVYGYLFYDFDCTDKYAPFINWKDNRYLGGIGEEEIEEEGIGQYTGLKDKNGKEIYEGDIVLYEDWEMAYEGGGNDSFINKGVIEYVNENCCFNVTERQTIELEDVLYEGNETLEVIGNIYENPELLKEEVWKKI